VKYQNKKNQNYKSSGSYHTEEAGTDKKKGGGMARRKQEIALQQEIETQEEWEDVMSKEGLYGNIKEKVFLEMKNYTLQGIEKPTNRVDLHLIKNAII
ncbi:hypothetical protein KUTeg_001855, partial [Tegillarca granosa]